MRMLSKKNELAAAVPTVYAVNTANAMQPFTISVKMLSSSGSLYRIVPVLHHFVKPRVPPYIAATLHATSATFGKRCISDNGLLNADATAVVRLPIS